MIVKHYWFPSQKNEIYNAIQIARERTYYHKAMQDYQKSKGITEISVDLSPYIIFLEWQTLDLRP